MTLSCYKDCGYLNEIIKNGGFMKNLFIFTCFMIAITSCSASLTGTSGGGSSSATADTTPPTVSVIYPLDNSIVGKSITVIITASDPSGVAGVYLSAVGVAEISATNISGNNWTAILPFASEGSNIISVHARDAAGNASQPLNIKVLVLFSIPSVTVTNPVDMFVTNSQNISVSGTVSVDTNYIITTVKLVVNNVTNVAVLGVGGTNWSYSAVLTANATNKIYAIALSSGNETNSSQVINVICDTIGPVGLISHPTNNLTVSTNFTVVGLATDNLTEVSLVTLRVSNNTLGTIQSYTVPANFNTNVSVAQYGFYTVWLDSIDGVNNLSKSPLTTVNVANIPVLHFMTPVLNGGLILTNTNSIDISGTAFVSSASITNIFIVINNITNNAVGTNNWTYNTGPLTAFTTNTLVAYAMADNGETSVAEFIRIYVDNSLPSLRVLSTGDISETGLKQYTVRGTASDIGTGLSKVFVNVDGGLYQQAVLTGTNWHITFAGYSGSHVNNVYSLDNSGNTSQITNISINVRKFKWNVIVYLEGGNNLEGNSLMTFNQMESISKLTNYDVNVIVLFDRTNGYDTSNDDWHGTRLYRVNYDPALISENTIRSTRIGGLLNGVNLTTIGDAEKLNMADPNTLSGFVDYTQSKYEADNQMFLIWNTSVQGFGGAVPKSSSIASALAGKGITVIGFDASQMGMFEAAYELRNAASYMIASPDIEPNAGWVYNDWLGDFCNSPMTVGNLITNIVNSYQAAYSTTIKAGLAVYDLSTMDSLLNSFNNYVSDLSGSLWNTNHINTASATMILFTNTIEQFYYNVNGGQLTVDVWDLADKIPLNNSIALKTAVESTVVYEWHHPGGTLFTDNPGSHGLALYFGSYNTNSDLVSNTSNYINSFNLFNAGSDWKNYLFDLYSFPGYAWIGNNAIQSGFVPLNGDIYYQIYVETTGNFTVTLYNFVGLSTNDFDLYLYDTQFNELINSTTKNQLEFINYTALTSGWYFINVNAYRGSGTYNMIVSNQGAGIR